MAKIVSALILCSLVIFLATLAYYYYIASSIIGIVKDVSWEEVADTVTTNIQTGDMSDQTGISTTVSKEPAPTPIDCGLKWSNWSNCQPVHNNMSGIKTQTATIVQQPENDGKACPKTLKKSQKCDFWRPNKTGGWTFAPKHWYSAFYKGLTESDKNISIDQSKKNCLSKPNCLGFHYIKSADGSTVTQYYRTPGTVGTQFRLKDDGNFTAVNNRFAPSQQICNDTGCQSGAYMLKPRWNFFRGRYYLRNTDKNPYRTETGYDINQSMNACKADAKCKGFHYQSAENTDAYDRSKRATRFYDVDLDIPSIKAGKGLMPKTKMACWKNPNDGRSSCFHGSYVLTR